MKKFLVIHEAVVGRTKEEGAALPPITMKVHGMVEAATLEEAQDKVVSYRDPGFNTRVVSVAEVGDGLTSDELYALLREDQIFKADTI